MLGTPPGLKTRPASDAMREALFSSIGNSIQGRKFADLFSGTGAYGLETWSRGGSKGTFVEFDPRCVQLIRENISRVAKSGPIDPRNLEVVCSNVFKWRSFEKHSFDMVFADPPYDQLKEIEMKLFELADNLLGNHGLFIVEHAADLRPEMSGWELVKQLGKKRGNGPSLTLWTRNSLLDLRSED